MSGVNNPYRYFYETVAASQTAQVLGTNGAVGDYLHRIIAVVTTAATSTVSILDDTTSISLLPATTVAGTYSLELNLRSKEGPWKVTTGAGVSVIAVGIFSA